MTVGVFAIGYSASSANRQPRGVEPLESNVWIDQWVEPFKGLGLWAFKDSISVYTLALTGATVWLAYITFRSVKLAREEFIATHRPRLIVRVLRRPFVAEHKRRFVHGSDKTMKWLILVLANIGESGAEIVECSADYDVPPNFDGWDALSEIIAGAAVIDPCPIGTVLAPGQQKPFAIISPSLEFGTSYVGEIMSVVSGAIRYKDKSGIVRTTAFYRTWDEMGGGDLVPSRDSSKEYAD